MTILLKLEKGYEIYESENISDISIKSPHYPYELIFDNTQKFKPVSLLLKNDEESKNLLIHFGEIWDNPYEYTVIFERNKDVFEILANDNYEYYYKIGKNKFKKADNLILNVKNYTNEIFYLRLASRSKALKWLKNSVYNISFKVSFDKSVKDLTDELVSSNFIFTKVDDWTLFINQILSQHLLQYFVIQRMLKLL